MRWLTFLRMGKINNWLHRGYFLRTFFTYGLRIERGTPKTIGIPFICTRQCIWYLWLVGLTLFLFSFAYLQPIGGECPQSISEQYQIDQREIPANLPRTGSRRKPVPCTTCRWETRSVGTMSNDVKQSIWTELVSNGSRSYT